MFSVFKQRRRWPDPGAAGLYQNALQGRRKVCYLAQLPFWEPDTDKGNYALMLNHFLILI